MASKKRIVYTTTRPNVIKMPFEKMLENDVEFGAPDKRSGGFLNSALDNCKEKVGVKVAEDPSMDAKYVDVSLISPAVAKEKVEL
ncbi:hypothetical protein Tco_1039627 [Tanacetum coccineum]